MNMRMVFALNAMVFAVIALVSIIAIGGEVSRNTAIAASMFGCASQSFGQDDSAWKWANGFAYGGFVLIAGSFVFLLAGM